MTNPRIPWWRGRAPAPVPIPPQFDLNDHVRLLLPDAPAMIVRQVWLWPSGLIVYECCWLDKVGVPQTFKFHEYELEAA